MSINLDNRLILSKIKSHYKFKSDAEFARFLGIKPQTLSTWHTRNSFDKDMVYSKCVGIDGNFLFTGFGEPFPSVYMEAVLPEVKPSGLMMPKVVTVNNQNEDLVSLVNVKAAAGYLNGYADPEYIETLPTISMPGLKGGTHRAFENSGHSMSPTLHNKSISVGQWVERFEDIRDRYIYIVVTKSEGIVIKRVLNRIEEREQLVLISDNQNKREYPNIILDAEDVLELWKLRAFVGFEFPEPTFWQDRFNDVEAQLTILNEQIKSHTHKLNKLIG